MPVTLESNRILIDTVEVETVKTHVPEVDIDIDIVPVITYPDTTTRNLQLAAESNTGVNGWRLVRFLPSNSGTWYSGNHFTSTNMEVTASLGTAYNYSNEFMVPFGTYDEIFFSTRNMQYWMHILKSNILGNYSDQPIDVISSSINPNNHTVPQQYNRSGIVQDPIITLTGYNANPRILLYLENSNGSVDTTLTDNGGMCVFVRTSTDTISSSLIPAMPVYEDTINQLQNLAEQKTGVKGWKNVRHLPTGTTQYYSGDDNFTGNFLLNETTKLDTEEWSIGYDSSYDEILFIRGDFTEWLYINRSDTTLTSTWIDRTSISTRQGTSVSYKYFNDGRTSAPWFYSNASYDETKIVFHEDVNSGGHTPGLNGDSFDMFVRTSTDTVTVNPEPVYKTLAFTYNGHGTAYPVIDVDSTNLIAHYKFDDDFTDSSGNGNDLTSVGTDIPLFQDNSLLLSGTPKNEKLEIPDFDFRNMDITISFGFKPITFYMTEQLIFFNNSSSNLQRLQFYTRDNGTKFQVIFNGTSGRTWDSQGIPLSLNMWHYIAFVITNGEQRLYINNIYIGKTTETHTPYIFNNNSIGYNNPDSKCLIKDFRIYDKALSATEISDLYNQYNQTSYTVNFQAESECDILIVGGGGAGGGNSGDGGWENGGGGGGGVLYMVNKKLNGEYKFIVGNGGINSGYDGSDSKIIKNDQVVSYDSIQLIGYGGGGGGSGNTHSQGTYGRSGGSAGGNNFQQTAYTSTATQGNTIWDGTSYIAGGYVGNTRGGGGSHGNTGGGGGGAGGSPIGVNNGGIGVEIDITGVPTYYAGGGGAAGSGVDGVGGLGGGGDPNASATDSSLPENGESHTGGGGGGAYTNTTLKKKGGNGGSGIVIIRYYTKYIRQHPAYDAQWTYHSANPNVHNYGNVGIGTLASETNKLTVKGDMNMIGNYKQNDVNLGNWYSSDNSNNIHRLTGNVGIGTTDPQYSVDTSGVLYASHGGFTGGTSTNWATSSDERIKDNITSASNETCYENVKNINLYKFNYKEQFANNKNETQYGFIAQEVQKYYPKAVKYEKIKVKDDTYENFLTINQTQLNYTLFGAVKHLQLELENIKVKLGMTVPVTEEPVVEETNTTEEPVAEETNTTEEPVAEETNTTEEPVAEETNTTEEPVAEETNTTEEPVAEETNTTEEPVAEETNTTEEPVAEETNTN